ncbi:uncharacterized protein YcfL [Bisgaardia hudsonensis]|uniref:Uncharacterized protein YcfL n=1 Tax=Bisgaardia hudsonensis TaxID=109472 RepID=A0A4V2SJ31_9PAST|nr:DUF1425 domain-containing protein [Bisgaardia hudsonensis]QLB13394.1 hypothetical protein A6A11_07125 [Bisgaardia hudsonensis]TCP12798.1 uncharacterized protein YcfL [Bisgaardia hudsonensis]
MKKIFLIIAITFGLVACGSSNTSPLSNDKQPILNIDSDLATLVDVKTSLSQAWIKNISNNAISVNYHFFWYNKNGVTQGNDVGQTATIILKPQQKTELSLQPPTENSVNYRLYLRLK